MPTHESPMIAQRRNRFVAGLTATGVSLPVAAVFGGWFWVMFTVVAAATIGYAAILRHLKLQRDEARRVVRALDLQVDDEDVDVAPLAVAGGGDESGAVRLHRWDD